MLNKQKISLYLFRSLWIILASGLIIYVLSQNVFTKRSLLYNLDFSKNISRDINGWYPSSRVEWQAGDQLLRVKAQPIYLRAYLPVDFNTLTVKGSHFASTTLRLGLKQADGTWFYKDVPSGDFILSFGLNQAKLQRRSLELSLSAPDLETDTSLYLVNNWQLLLER